MTQFIYEIVVKLLETGLPLAALVYLFKIVIKLWTTKDIENYKNELKTKSELEVENYKNQLLSIAKEHEIRFQSLHKKRAEVINQFYVYLNDVINIEQDFFNKIEVEKIDNFKKNFNCCFDYYLKNKLYFSKKICEKIEEFKEIMQKELFKYLEEGHFSEERKNKFIDDFKKLVNQIKNELENDFRKILGVEIT